MGHPSYTILMELTFQETIWTINKLQLQPELESEARGPGYVSFKLFKYVSLCLVVYLSSCPMFFFVLRYFGPMKLFNFLYIYLNWFSMHIKLFSSINLFLCLNKHIEPIQLYLRPL